MIKIAGIKNEYVSVGKGGSYGGSQELFKYMCGFFNKYRALSGCGIVAMSDTISYLAGNTVFLEEENYKRYFKKISNLALWIPTKLGMSIYRLMLFYPRLLNRYAAGDNFKYKCFWGLSHKELLGRIEEMLKNDIPVIMNIPKLILPHHKKKKLNFYALRESDAQISGTSHNAGLSYATRTSAHFVVVTGIFFENNRIYLKISSWGRKYYIDYDEYIAFTKRTPLGFFLGNIMYVKKSLHN